MAQPAAVANRGRPARGHGVRLRVHRLPARARDRRARSRWTPPDGGGRVGGLAAVGTVQPRDHELGEELRRPASSPLRRVVGGLVALVGALAVTVIAVQHRFADDTPVGDAVPSEHTVWNRVSGTWRSSRSMQLVAPAPTGSL